MNRTSNAVTIFVPATGSVKYQIWASGGYRVFNRGAYAGLWVQILPEEDRDLAAANAVKAFQLPEKKLLALAEKHKPPQWWYETEESLF